MAKLAKQQTWKWLAAVCILLLLLLPGGIYARYRSEVAREIQFQSPDIRLLQIHGHTDETARNSGEWMPVPTVWTEEGGISELSFCVSNGSSAQNFSAPDYRFRVRVTATAGFDPDKASISLATVLWQSTEAEDQNPSTASEGTSASLPAEEIFKPQVLSSIQGVGTEITTESPLYQKIGDGWLYCFYDENGKELLFDLSGGKLSVVELMLRISGKTDVSMLRFEILPQLGDQ